LHRCATVLSLIAAALVAAPGYAAAQADDPHAKHRQMQHGAKESARSSLHIELQDAELVTQEGRPVKLATDVIGDKIVVVDFIYTTCTTVCPVLSAIMRQVQERLDERLGHEVLLVSISVDPTRDTPARLRAYSRKLGARDGWFWLTGDKTIVDAILKDFGAYTPNFEDHPSMMLVGDGRSGEWGRFLGFPGAEQIMQRIDELSAARTQAAIRE
jgi:protein SCO1/2